MARREWPLRFVCGHQGCIETANYRYSTKRDMMESFEMKHYSNGRWRCIRHTRPDEVLSEANSQTRVELVVDQRPHGKFLGHSGFVSGPGFKVFANDLPPGAKIVVTASLVLPQIGDPA